MLKKVCNCAKRENKHLRKNLELHVRKNKFNFQVKKKNHALIVLCKTKSSSKKEIWLDIFS